MLTKRELDKIKANLPARWTVIIGERANVSPSLAQKVLSEPTRYKASVIEAAIQLAEEHKQELKTQKQKINQLKK